MKTKWLHWLVIVFIGFCFVLIRFSFISTVAKVRGTISGTDKLENALSVDSKRRFDLTIWSSDFHISPVADIKHLLSQYGVKVIDKSLSGHCHLTNTCESDLRVLTTQNGINLGRCPNNLIREFYQSYRNDPEMNAVQAILCTHAISMCELFMPFNKSLIAISSTRFEIGRHDKIRWQIWVENLIRIASQKRNIVAANNAYDLEYIKYFTNISQVLLLPSYCGYVTDRYNPIRNEILIAPSRGVNLHVMKELQEALDLFHQRNQISLHSKVPVTELTMKKPSYSYMGDPGNSSRNNGLKLPLKLSPIRELYNQYKYKDLASHPAIILLPYQVSFMSFFEYYRMGIPMFAPSPSLLARWHIKYSVLNERTWSTVFGMPSDKSVLSRHPQSLSTRKYDPNNEYSEEAVLEWVALADFYTFPHIQHFESWEELFDLLTHAELLAISEAMLEYSRQEEVEIRSKWKEILGIVQQNSNAQVRHQSGENFETADAALMALYGVKLSDDCV